MNKLRNELTNKYIALDNEINLYFLFFGRKNKGLLVIDRNIEYVSSLFDKKNKIGLKLFELRIKDIA